MAVEPTALSKMKEKPSVIYFQQIIMPGVPSVPGGPSLLLDAVGSVTCATQTKSSTTVVS